MLADLSRHAGRDIRQWAYLQRHSRRREAVEQGRVLLGAQAVADPLGLQSIAVTDPSTCLKLNTSTASHGIKPVIDREFAFAEAPAALAHMKSGAHFGKIVIRVGS